MSLLLNRAKETTATTGTGTVTLGGAVSPFQTWATAQPGSSTTRLYSYLIEDGTAWEIGEGVFNKGANTLTRGLIGSSTGSLLSLSGSATVACVMKSVDVPQVIEKKTFTGSETSFTFSDIPQDFNALELEVWGRLTGAGTSNFAAMTVNGLTTAIYDLQRAYTTVGSASGDQFLGQTSLTNVWNFTGSSYPTGQAFGIRMRFPGYTSTALHKLFNGDTYNWPNSTSTFQHYVLGLSGGIRTTAAIVSIESGTFPSALISGSYAILRGIP